MVPFMMQMESGWLPFMADTFRLSHSEVWQVDGATQVVAEPLTR